jgi:hypothetical protein
MIGGREGESRSSEPSGRYDEGATWRLTAVAPDSSSSSPDVTAEEIRAELAARQATYEEFVEFVREHEGELLPADDEG